MSNTIELPKARKEGFDAYCTGVAMEDNPYKLACQERDEWHAGWLDAYYDVEEA